MNEMQRVLSECDELGKSALGARYQIALGDAARLIRELAGRLAEIEKILRYQCDHSCADREGYSGKLRHSPECMVPDVYGTEGT